MFSNCTQHLLNIVNISDLTVLRYCDVVGVTLLCCNESLLDTWHNIVNNTNTQNSEQLLLTCMLLPAKLNISHQLIFDRRIMRVLFEWDLQDGLIVIIINLSNGHNLVSWKNSAFCDTCLCSRLKIKNEFILLFFVSWQHQYLTGSERRNCSESLLKTFVTLILQLTQSTLLWDWAADAELGLNLTLLEQAAAGREKKSVYLLTQSHN